jgi:hypothetical protein
MLDNRMQGMPGDEVWLVGERRSTGEQKYYVSNLPVDTSLNRHPPDGGWFQPQTAPLWLVAQS